LSPRADGRRKGVPKGRQDCRVKGSRIKRKRRRDLPVLDKSEKVL